MKTKPHSFKLVVAAGIALLAATGARAVDFHCATAQDLQNALTIAAGNGANDNIYLTNGYYVGNFNFNSTGGYNLSILAEPGVTNTQITIDGAGTGRDMNLANTAAGNFTVRGITFLRNCGNASYGALRVAAGASSSIVIDTCRFLSPTNTSGMGVELASGLNVMLTNCIITGISQNSYGVYVQGITGSALVLSSAINVNSSGIYINSSALSSGAFSATNNLINSNSHGIDISGSYVSVSMSGNVFSGNYMALNANNAYSVIASNNFVGNNGTVTLVNPPNTSGTYVLFNGNTVSGNIASQGCTFMARSNVVTGNLFSGNSGNWGGGLYCPVMTYGYVSGNTFNGNSATYGGGAAALDFSGTLIVSSNMFTQNSTGGSGGGGGALYISADSASTAIVQDNLVTKNNETSPSGFGSGVYVNEIGNLFCINNTIFGNTAVGNGGGLGITLTGTTELLNVYNNIIWGNTASGNGADVWLAGTGQKKTFLNNDVHNMYGVWDIAQSLLDVDPKFFDAVNGDYHLQTNSPCASFGTNGAPSLPLTDLDGNLRTNSLGQVDLGCYEFNNTAKHPADTNGDFIISAAEYAAYAAAWKAGQPWTSAPASAPNPNPIPANFVTRAGYLMTNGSAYYNNGSARPTNWRLIGQ